MITASTIPSALITGFDASARSSSLSVTPSATSPAALRATPRAWCPSTMEPTPTALAQRT